MLRPSLVVLATSVVLWATVTAGCSDDPSPAPATGGNQGEGGQLAEGGMGGATSDMGGGGMGTTGCKELDAGLTSVLERSYDATLEGGLAIAVRTESCSLWLETIGDPALTPEATIKVVSVSKMLLASTVMLLIEDGALALDDTVDAWFPLLPNADAITIHHLLDHTSGLFDYVDDPAHVDAVIANVNYPWSAAELIQYAIDNPPTSEPGAVYDGKFVDSIILGEIVSAVTSQPIEAAIRARVLEPLGVTNTYLLGPEGSADFVVQGYNENGTPLGRLLHPNIWGVSASYASTMEETVTIVEDILTTDLLTSESRDAMVNLTVSTGVNDVRYGLGVDVSDSGGERLIGQDGALPGYEVRAYYSPELDATFVVFANNDDAATFGTLHAAIDAVRAAQEL